VICFFWGILAVIAFGAIAFNTQLFGNMILYWAFYVPAQVVAWILWYRASDNKIEIKPVKMKWWQIVIAISLILAFAILFSYIETITKFQEIWFGKGFKGADHLLIRYIFDATILVSSIALAFFAWLRFRERWILSIFIDTIQTIMWILVACGGDLKHRPSGFDFNNASWIMVASSLTMLIAAIYGAYNWWRQDNSKE
jgi:nicotinamide mononucleotide transporter PnuC